MERLAEKNTEKVKILKVDVNKDVVWADEEKVEGVPSFRIYSKGEKVKQFTGAAPEEDLQKMIDDYSAKAAKEALSATPVGENGEPVSKEESIFKPMPKDWLPPGITRQ